MTKTATPVYSVNKDNKKYLKEWKKTTTAKLKMAKLNLSLNQKLLKLIEQNFNLEEKKEFWHDKNQIENKMKQSKEIILELNKQLKCKHINVNEVLLGNNCNDDFYADKCSNCKAQIKEWKC